MYEENNPPDISLDEVRLALEEFFPDRELNIEFYYHGGYNVFIVDGEYIFRFASAHIPIDESRKLLLNEVKTLNNLKDYLTVQIPKPEFIDVDSDIPMMGYRKIPGISLSRCYDNTTHKQQVTLAEQAASFLGELHSDKIKDIFRDDRNFTPEKYHREWSDFFTRLQDFVYPLLWSNAVYWTESLFLEFLECQDNFEFNPCVVHGDYDTSNILVDPETLAVTGVIDFEETGYYDPAADLLFFREGDAFLGTLLRSYPGNLDSTIKNRMRFRFGRQPLIYIEYGLTHEIESMVSYGLDELSQRMTDWKMYKSMLDVAFKGLE